MSTNASVSQQNNDVIDPFELAQSFWDQKWLILGVAALVTAFALVYSLTATPIYETRTSVVTPKRSDILGYNLARLSIATAMGTRLEGHDSSDTVPPVFTTHEVYSVFRRNLFSASLRTEFFESHYLPYVGESTSQDQAIRDRLLINFRRQLVVLEPDPQDRPGYYEVKVEMRDPATAAKWANEYVAVAAVRAEQEMMEDVASEITSRLRVTAQQIKGLRESARAQRMDRIAQLEEALQVAIALGLDEPQITAGRVNADSELAAFVEGSLMYTRGSKALGAELEVLRNREIDDPFVPDLRRLQSRLELLENIKVDPDSVAVYAVDGVAEVPNTPIRPNKPMIVILSALFGGMLGCVVALVRFAGRNRVKHKTAQ